jgi:hypothetical protein
MMSESNSIPESRLRLGTLSRLRRLAKVLLDGPRAVMLPNDPKGLKLWFEPTIRMKTYSTGSKTTESLAIYSVPNCLEHSPTSPVLIRRSCWETGKDKDLVFTQRENDLPTIVTSFKQLAEGQLAVIDNLLRQLDESLVAFPFPVEGLDLYGASGFKPLPDDAEILTNTVHNELRRTTRFCCFEIHWSPVETNLSKLDQAWQALFDTLASLTEHPRATMDIEPMEKYDVDPVNYANLFKADRQ